MQGGSHGHGDLRVAAGQLTAHALEQASAVWERVARMASQARSAGARLLVLPECTFPAYWLESAERARGPDILPATEVLQRLASIAAAERLLLICGFAERDGERLYNSAAVIDADGRVIGVSRKTFLWDCDNRWFLPGERIDVWPTPAGRLGVLICADARAPETAATLAARGAELVVMPTAWVHVAGREDRYNIQPDFLIECRAREFALPFVCADKSGDEPPLRYVGQSLIVDAAGRVLHRGPIDGEALLVADVRPGAPRPARLMATQRTRLSTRPAAPPRGPQRPARIQVLPRRFDVGPAKAAVLRGVEMASFVEARCLALAGVEALCVENAADDLGTLRSRAAENRVFVLARSADRAWIIGPEGGVRAAGEACDGVSADVDVSEARVKRFTPETDIWAQRRVECYEFDPPAPLPP